MTLEDFFTLTEMNNGLTSPSRVKELMAVMQKERDIVKNSSDSTRQWSAVASVIAATENKDCLDLFVQLDGLHFISCWLKDAQKLSDDAIGSFVEDSITHLLRALEKLHADYEKLVVSEIWTTVQDLLVHNSSKVQDKARVLFESWKTERESDASLSDVEKTGARVDVEAGKGADIERGIEHLESSLGDTSISTETSVKDKGQQLTRDDTLLSTSPHNSDKILDSLIEDERTLDHLSSPSIPKPTEEPPLSRSISTMVEPCSPSVSRHGSLVQSPKTESLPEKLGSLEESKTSEIRPFTCEVDEMKPVTELNSQKNSTTGEEKENSCDNGVSYVDSRMINSIAKEGSELNHRLLSKSSNIDKSWGQSKNLGTFLSGIEDDGKSNAFCLHLSDDGLANIYNFGKKQLDREPNRACKKSDVEIEYGIVDPLEVAMQVAMEVEREAVYNTERSCNSSGKLPEGNVQQPPSPDSVTGKLSHESSPMLEESASSSEDLDDDENTNDPQDMATSQVTEAPQEEAKSEKGFCDFDLNQEVCSEDADHNGNQFPTPVSVVSASRAAAAPGLPIAPLQFKGNLGWKGSAATSAFRPASPRRMPENEKDPSSSSSSKQRPGLLDFDLNVAESGDPRTGESSVETNSRISEHLELDLNLTSHDGGAPSVGHFFPILNSHISSSHSSSSTKQLRKNFDLNDQPYSSKVSQNFNFSGDFKSDDSVISIMGKKVEVNRKDFVSQTRPLSNVLPYVNSSVYSYNNIVGPTIPFSPAVYGSAGPIPYMVDSRGVPVIPQIVGSVSALPTAFSQQPFVMSMNSSIPSNGAGPSRSSFDLNSGMLMEGGSKDPSGFGLFLNSAQVRSMEEQMRSNSQSTITSAASGKRKEPDNGWESYPFRHYTPPWKPS